MPKLKQTSLPHGKPKNRTAAEAARLGISEDKLSELVKQGIIPVIKLGHSTHLFDPEKTDAGLLRHGAQLCQDGRIPQPLRSLLFMAQLRCYRVWGRCLPRAFEFIGYRVARDEDENRGASRISHNLYKDIIGGWLHYSYGYEGFPCHTTQSTRPPIKPFVPETLKVFTSTVHVVIGCDRWCCGKNLEEMRAQFRDLYGPDVEIPSLLESPPEVETMYRETGYDS